MSETDSYLFQRPKKAARNETRNAVEKLKDDMKMAKRKGDVGDGKM